MAQIGVGLLCWPKHSSTNNCGGGGGGASAAEDGCLWRLVRKLKKHMYSRMLGSGSRESPFRCQYDPLSYSLNFDTSGCGNSLDEDDYYHFYAFSSRFVANPTTVISPPTLLPTTTH